MSETACELLIGAYLVFLISSQIAGTIGYYRAKRELSKGVLAMIAVTAWTAVVIAAHWKLGFWH